MLHYFYKQKVRANLRLFDTTVKIWRKCRFDTDRSNCWIITDRGPMVRTAVTWHERNRNGAASAPLDMTKKHGLSSSPREVSTKTVVIFV